MSKGLFHPKNFAENTGGGMKEGLVRVESSVFKVHQGRESKDGAPGAIKMALVWSVTRLDEDQQPLTHAETGAAVTEELVFGIGGKALPQVHPGKADSPDDDESEDLGDEVNTEGNTIYLVNGDFRLHPKTALAYLQESLKAAGWKEEYLLREWAPDYVGSVFHMKTQIGDEKMEDKVTGKKTDINYKIVDKIIRAGYEAKASKSAPAAAKGKKGETEVTAAPAKEKGGSEAETLLKPILEKLSEDLDGQRMSGKAFRLKVTAMLQQSKVPNQQHVPILSLLKDEKWLAKNAAKFDMTVDSEENTVTFGTYAESD
jgi:hypothetical protein